MSKAVILEVSTIAKSYLDEPIARFTDPETGKNVLINKYGHAECVASEQLAWDIAFEREWDVRTVSYVAFV